LMLSFGLYLALFGTAQGKAVTNEVTALNEVPNEVTALNEEHLVRELGACTKVYDGACAKRKSQETCEEHMYEVRYDERQMDACKKAKIAVTTCELPTRGKHKKAKIAGTYVNCLWDKTRCRAHLCPRPPHNAEDCERDAKYIIMDRKSGGDEEHKSRYESFAKEQLERNGCCKPDMLCKTVGQDLCPTKCCSVRGANIGWTGRETVTFVGDGGEAMCCEQCIAKEGCGGWVFNADGHCYQKYRVDSTPFPTSIEDKKDERSSGSAGLLAAC